MDELHRMTQLKEGDGRSQSHTLSPGTGEKQYTSTYVSLDELEEAQLGGSTPFYEADSSQCVATEPDGGKKCGDLVQPCGSRRSERRRRRSESMPLGPGEDGKLSGNRECFLPETGREYRPDSSAPGNGESARRHSDVGFPGKEPYFREHKGF